MPNWCSGYVNVMGKSKDVENFCKLFLFEEDTNNKELSKKYFARSFTQLSWKDFKEEHFIKEVKGDSDISFHVDFAWSCNTCLFEGYPNGKQCVTLEWACKKYNVEVEIESEERGDGFEEEISYTKEDGINYDCQDMPTHTCNKCGNEQTIGKHDDIENEECYECGRDGTFVDELQQIVKEKLNQIEGKI